MLKSNEKEVLRDKVCQLLWQEGMKIENDELVETMLARGCEQAPSGRIRIPGEIIDEMTASQKKTQAIDDADQELHYRCGIDWAHHVIWNGKQKEITAKLDSQLLMPAFDCGPTTYYDYQKSELLPVGKDIFIDMKKLAQATPEVGYISTWYRQDTAPQIERIESLIMAFEYTDKVDGIEAIYPEVIKYLKEISEIVTGRPGDASYLAGSECITSPLILEKRSAADIVERAKCDIKRYHIASMPAIGISTPVTVAGSIVMTAGEILGGMAVCFVLDPEADLSGRSIALSADMRTANNTATGPESGMVNFAVKEVFDAFWGGHLWVEVTIGTFALRPGLQAMFENFYAGYRATRLLGRSDLPYPGVGTIGTGGVGSPTQFVLDLDIRKAQFALKDTVSLDDDQMIFDTICEITRGDKEFLTSDHTLAHCRDLWASPLFGTQTPGMGGWEGDEKAILDKCDAMWRETVKTWQPPQWPTDNTKELQKVLAKAKKEFGID